MYLLIGVLAFISLFFAVRYYLMRREIKRLTIQIGELGANARFGQRLYLEENDHGLTKAILDYVEGISNKTDTGFALNFFNPDREKAVRSFTEYVNKENSDKCLDIPEKHQLTDDDARNIIKDHCKVDHPLYSRS